MISVGAEPDAVTAGRRRRNPEATREQILAAARTVLASDGPDSLSLSRVAHLAGVNRGTAYQHFETKEELIKAAVASVSQHLTETLFPAQAADAAEPDAADRPIYESMTALAEFAVENPELGRIWLFEILSCEDPSEDVFFRQFVRSVEAMARSEQSEEGIDAEVLSVMILAGYFLWPAWARGGSGDPAERRRMSRRMRREMLRLSLHGTLRAEAFPQLERLLQETVA